MVEIGKAAKHMGIQHPRVIRRIDFTPPRPTPAVSGRRSRRPFGFSYLSTVFRKEGFRHYDWFATVKARDQSMADLTRKSKAWDWISDIKVEER